VKPEPQVGGRRGRTITAVGLTLADALDQLLSASLLAGFEQDVIRVGGLRAGYVRAGQEALELHGAVYVPGVRLRGRIVLDNRPHGAVRVTGKAAAQGRIAFRRDGSVTGRLGGRRIRVRAAGRSRTEAAQLARGGITRVLDRLGQWRRGPSAPVPHSHRLP